MSVKLNASEARVMQALRAGPMESSELSDRFPSGYPMAKLIKQGLVENGKFGYQLTDAGKAACPSRRAIEKASILPKAQETAVVKQKPAPTISMNAVKLSTIKQPEVIMPQIQNIPPISTATQIRDLIKAKPGISQNEIIVSITGSNRPDDASIKKVKDLISYVVGQGNFTKRKEMNEQGDMVNCYYLDHDNVKRAKAEATPPAPSTNDAVDIKVFTGTTDRETPAPLEPTISIQFTVLIPEMPDKLKLVGIRKSNLDDAIATGDSYTVDVATLDDNAVDALCAQWAAKFKAHVQKRKQLL